MKRTRTTRSTSGRARRVNPDARWISFALIVPVAAATTALAANGNPTGYWLFAPSIIALYASWQLVTYGCADKPRYALPAFATLLSSGAVVTAWAVGQIATVLAG